MSRVRHSRRYNAIHLQEGSALSSESTPNAILRLHGREISVGAPVVDPVVEARDALRVLQTVSFRVERTLAAVAQKRVNDAAAAAPRPLRTPGVWVGEVESPASARPSIAAAPGVSFHETELVHARIDSPDEALHAYEIAFERAEQAMKRLQTYRDDPDLEFDDDPRLRLPAWRDW